MTAPTRPAVHSPLRSPTTTVDGPVWAGRFNFDCPGTGPQVITFTDANWTSRVIRASNHIICTPANVTAAHLVAGWANTLADTHRSGCWFNMTNNASLVVSANIHASDVGQAALFYYMVFAGGTLV